MVTVRVSGDGLALDFSGSGKEARGAMNVPTNALHACVYYSIKALLDPELLPNAGLFDAVSICAPPGSIVFLGPQVGQVPDVVVGHQLKAGQQGVELGLSLVGKCHQVGLKGGSSRAKGWWR